MYILGHLVTTSEVPRIVKSLSVVVKSCVGYIVQSFHINNAALCK